MESNLRQRKSTLTMGGGMLTVHLIAGVLAGIVGLLVFLVIHHFLDHPHLVHPAPWSGNRRAGRQCGHTGPGSDRQKTRALT